MARNSKVVVGLVLIVAVLLVAVGYATITAVTLNIKGKADANTDTKNFVVRFTGTPTTSGQGTTTATLSTTDQLKATMNVAGLTAKGDTATATFTIANDSADLSAALSAVSTCSNTEYFSISHNIAETPLAKGETTTITITVELIKTPIDVNPTGTIDVVITADPQQPA